MINEITYPDICCHTFRGLYLEKVAPTLALVCFCLSLFVDGKVSASPVVLKGWFTQITAVYRQPRWQL